MIFILTFIVSLSSYATNYFNWGAESMKLHYGINGPGIYTVEFFGSTTIDCTVKHSGNCSMRINVIGNDNGNQQLGIDTIAHNPPYPWTTVGAPAIYYRWWMKIMPGFSWGSGTIKTKSFRTGGPNDEHGWTPYLFKNAFVIAECDTSGCLTNTGASAANDGNMLIPYSFLSDGVWHEYVVMIKPNTNGNCTAGVNCDAKFKAWVDGTVVGEYNNYKLVDANHNFTQVDFWGSWMIRPFFQLNATASDGGVIFLDDFSTDDQFNSIYPATTPKLKAPSNLRIQG